MSEPVAVVDWDQTSIIWCIWRAQSFCGRFRSAFDACSNADAWWGPLRWECAGPHTFHGYPIQPEDTE